MRREGRQRGWVRTYDLCLWLELEQEPDEDGNYQPRRPISAHTAVPGTAIANGGFVRAPRRPTNHSKPSGMYKPPGGKGDGSSASGKGRHKFWHDELKTYYLDLADAVDGYAMD
jgi:hypothetical protein